MKNLNINEWWYSFSISYIDPWYYPIKDWFSPHNVQKIRNTPRSWNDRSERVIHCVFSMLCDFVEREEGGLEQLEQSVVRLEQDKEFCNCKSQINNWKEIIFLYKWYRSINWNEIHFMDDIYQQAEDMCIRAIKTRRHWWT